MGARFMKERVMGQIRSVRRPAWLGIAVTWFLGMLGRVLAYSLILVYTRQHKRASGYATPGIRVWGVVSPDSLYFDAIGGVNEGWEFIKLHGCNDGYSKKSVTFSITTRMLESQPMRNGRTSSTKSGPTWSQLSLLPGARIGSGTGLTDGE